MNATHKITMILVITGITVIAIGLAIRDLYTIITGFLTLSLIGFLLVSRMGEETHVDKTSQTERIN